MLLQILVLVNTIGIIDQVSSAGSTVYIDFTINGTGEITIAYNWSGDDSSGLHNEMRNVKQKDFLITI